MSDREYFLLDQIDFLEQQIAVVESHYEKSPEDEKEYLLPIFHDLKDKLGKYKEELELLKLDSMN